jgi:hypothetical protein
LLKLLIVVDELPAVRQHDVQLSRSRAVQRGLSAAYHVNVDDRYLDDHCRHNIDDIDIATFDIATGNIYCLHYDICIDISTIDDAIDIID